MTFYFGNEGKVQIIDLKIKNNGMDTIKINYSGDLIPRTLCFSTVSATLKRIFRKKFRNSQFVNFSDNLFCENGYSVKTNSRYISMTVCEILKVFNSRYGMNPDSCFTSLSDPNKKLLWKFIKKSLSKDTSVSNPLRIIGTFGYCGNSIDVWRNMT